MPLTYRQVLERYDRSKAFGFKGTLPEYAQALNDATQTQAFSEGLRDGPWTRFSTRVDQTLGPGGAVPIGAVTGSIGEGVGAAFGHAEAGRSVGEGLPRGVLQTVPLLVPGAGQGYGLALAAGATGAMFGGQTYADTGSAKAATISGVAGAAMPYAGRFAGALGARAFGAQPLAGEITQTGAAAGLGEVGQAFRGTLPTSPGQIAGQFLGSQTGQAALQIGAQYAQEQTLNPGQAFNPFSAEFLLGQLPFTAVDAVQAIKTPRITRSQAESFVKPIQVEKTTSAVCAGR